ncbi:MAG TPA: hypothetical protein VLX91_05720 [Candidatus Acidoferrales bacterium]|nr:hypothetical protein [Candidatus Acidoferrales bacterium]
MSVKIIRQPTNYLLTGASRGLLLTVDCCEQLSRYNRSNKLLNVDLNLLNAFTAANNIQSLAHAIDTLIQSYRLHRKPPFNGDEFAPILFQHLEEIHGLPEATIQTVDQIANSFQELRQHFSEQMNRDLLLPNVTLSKLLHFVQPISFWILDSRVKTVMDIWGYATTFVGFGEMLRDLFSAPDFGDFRTFVENRNAELVAEHPIHTLPCSFLKLVDKILWFTKD